MKIPIIVWRESVYKNDFRCSCGEQLMKDGQLSDKLLFDPIDNLVVCPNCKKTVAMIKGEMEAEDGKSKYKGKWTEA